MSWDISKPINADKTEKEVIKNGDVISTIPNVTKNTSTEGDESYEKYGNGDGIGYGNGHTVMAATTALVVGLAFLL